MYVYMGMCVYIHGYVIKYVYMYMCVCKVIFRKCDDYLHLLIKLKERREVADTPIYIYIYIYIHGYVCMYPWVSN